MTRADLGHERDHLSDGLAVGRRVGHVRTEMTLKTGQVQQRLIQCPLDRVRGMPVGEREPKPLVGQVLGHGTVLVEFDVGRDADLYGLVRSCGS